MTLVVKGSSLSGQATTNHNRPSAILNIEALEKCGKCVDGEALVTTLAGPRIKVRDLRAGMKLAGDIRVVDARLDGIKPTLVIETSEQRTVRVTKEHRFLTPTGWAQAKELTVGGLIAVPYEVKVRPRVKVAPELAKLIGYLLADGSLGKKDQSHSTMEITKHEVLVREDICDSALALGFRTAAYDTAVVGFSNGPGWSRETGNPLTAFRDEYGLRGRAAEKEFPEQVFAWDNESVALLLNRYFTCDGWVCRSSSTGMQVGFSSASLKMLEQVRHLLLRFGVVGHTNSRVVNGRTYYAWATATRGARTFVSAIGFFGGKQKKALKLVQAKRGVEPYRYGRKVKPFRYGKDETPTPVGMMWAEVAKVETGLAVPVYDVEVDDPECRFVVNDILTHNTRFCLTAPGPIAYFRVGDRKIDFLLDGLGLKRGVDILEGDYHYRPPITVSASGGDLVNTIANEARPIWKRFENDFLLTLKDKQIRTIVIDNAGAMYELRRLAKFGKLEQVPPIMYVQVNTEMSYYFTIGREFPEKNFLYIHRLKDKWVNTVNPKNPKGPKVGERTGELERAGWKDAGFEVDATVRLSKVKKTYTAEITDTGFSGLGETLENEDITFANICATVFGMRPKDFSK